MLKPPQVWSTFGSCVAEKLSMLVARSTSPSQNAQSKSVWQLRCWKNACSCAAKYSPSQNAKNTSVSERSKVHAVVAPSTGWSQNVKNTTRLNNIWKFVAEKVRAAVGRSKFRSKNAKTHVRIIFGCSSVILRGRLTKASQTWGLCSRVKAMAGIGRWRSASPARRSTKDISSRHVRRWGRGFPEGGCVLEHQTGRFVKMILRDRRSTSYDLAAFFHSRRAALDR